MMDKKVQKLPAFYNDTFKCGIELLIPLNISLNIKSGLG